MSEHVLSSREVWLQQASVFLMEHMQRCGLAVAPVRVSCGWPVVGGGLGCGNVGQCFAAELCQDGIPQIFISPRLADSIVVLGALLHELLHVSIGCAFGHRREFSQAMRRVGLAGAPAAMVVSVDLAPMLQEYIQRVGIYPHAAILPVSRGRVGSRLRLYECACTPPVKVRVASKNYLAQCLHCGGQFALSC